MNHLKCFECQRRDETVKHSNERFVPLCPAHTPAPKRIGWGSMGRAPRKRSASGGRNK